MPKRIDHTGERFGNLVALYQDKEKSKEKKRTYWTFQCDCGNIKSLRLETVQKGQTTCGECKNDLTNKRFGKLIALKCADERTSSGGKKWLCQCDCGNQTTVAATSLKTGNTVSCGCYHKERLKELGSLHLEGKQFGRLTVLNEEPKVSGHTKWKCKCECGNEIIVFGYALTTGHTNSCGCLKSKGEEIIRKLLEESNISFKQQVLLEGLPMRFFDFGIYSVNGELKRLIEFDGEQHFNQPGYQTTKDFEKAKNRDREKNQYTLFHNIPLVRIPYWERDNITLEMILGDKYLVKDNEGT